MKKMFLLLALLLAMFTLGGCSSNEETKSDDAETGKTQTVENETELTDEEFERVQAVFKEYVGEELEYKPKYCGEWRNGNQFVTENFAYGQYLINMDVDGQ